MSILFLNQKLFGRVEKKNQLIDYIVIIKSSDHFKEEVKMLEGDLVSKINI